MLLLVYFPRPDRFSVLPSFQDIEIEFALFTLSSEKSYQMQFPLIIKHNKCTFFVNLKGTGVQMTLVVDPTQLIFRPLKCCDPLQARLETIKLLVLCPTSYPDDVCSGQYDFNIYCQELMEQIDRNELNSVEEPVVISHGKHFGS